MLRRKERVARLPRMGNGLGGCASCDRRLVRSASVGLVGPPSLARGGPGGLRSAARSSRSRSPVRMSRETGRMPASTYFRRLTGFRKPVEHTGQHCPRAWPMTPHSRGYGGPFATPPAIHLADTASCLFIPSVFPRVHRAAVSGGNWLMGLIAQQRLPSAARPRRPAPTGAVTPARADRRRVSPPRLSSTRGQPCSRRRVASKGRTNADWSKRPPFRAGSQFLGRSPQVERSPSGGDLPHVWAPWPAHRPGSPQGAAWPTCSPVC